MPESLRYLDLRRYYPGGVAHPNRLLEFRDGYPVLPVCVMLRVPVILEALEDPVMARGDEAHTTGCLTRVLYWCKVTILTRVGYAGKC